MRRAAFAVAAAVWVMAQAPAPAPSAPDTWQKRDAAELVLLDKVRAQPTTVQVTVGQTATFGSLSIALRGCAVRPPDLPADAVAYLDVTDSRSPAGFHGWMFANTPSVAQLEHPIYDLRVVACR